MSTVNSKVDFIVFESMKATQERTIRRMWITNIILILSIVALVVFFTLFLENKQKQIDELKEDYETVEETTIFAKQETDDGDNYAVGGDYYGYADSNNKDG